MRTVRVLTNETCDHRCSFCDARRDHERASVAAHAAVIGRIDAAGDAAQIVLTGGEPSLRRDLPRLVARARSRGAKVVLESNGAHPESAAALADAGLAIVRLHVPGVLGHAHVTGDPSAYGRVCAAAAAYAAAGVGVEAVIPIVAATAGELATMPAAIVRAMPAVTMLWARIVQRAPDVSAALAPGAAIAAFETLCEAARAVPVPVQLDPATWLPPCLLRRPDRHAHAYAMGPGGAARADHVTIDACLGCNVADRCPGVPQPWLEHATGHASPITEARMRRRLSQIGSVRAQIARELVTDEFVRREDGTTVASRTVRIGFACNQACRFCFVSTHLPTAPHDDIAVAIDDIAARGGVLVLSGGEPTLDPQLLVWVRRGRAGGAGDIELQTNATRIDDALATELVEAGVTVAFVSLHAATAAVSDAITQAPGTFAKSLAGLDALAPRVPELRINFVFCRANVDEFARVVELVADRWPQAALTVSFVAPSTDLVPREAGLIPRYTEVMPSLLRGLERARERGVRVLGFESMCGIPLCLLPHAEREVVLALPAVPAGIDRGGSGDDVDGGEFERAPACEQCDARPACYGIRRGYAALHGTGELRPIRHGGGGARYGPVC